MGTGVKGVLNNLPTDLSTISVDNKNDRFHLETDEAQACFPAAGPQN
jgi:hypothetical protein